MHFATLRRPLRRTTANRTKTIANKTKAIANKTKAIRKSNTISNDNTIRNNNSNHPSPTHSNRFSRKQNFNPSSPTCKHQLTPSSNLTKPTRTTQTTAINNFHPSTINPSTVIPIAKIDTKRCKNSQLIEKTIPNKTDRSKPKATLIEKIALITTQIAVISHCQCERTQKIKQRLEKIGNHQN
jgi:hypothetical protein